MFLSRIWLVLVAAVAAAAVALLLLQPRPMQSELDAQLEGRLGGADRGTALLIKMHARKWIDAASQVSSDAPLYEALDQATRGGGNPELIHRSTQARLRYFNQDWKTDLVLAVDGKGRVVARAGLDEEVWRDDISGYPLVTEALRGYRLDDTWEVRGKLYRVCASPVIARDRYVGALLVAQELGSDLAGRIHDTMGVDVAFLASERVVAQSSALPILGELPKLATAHAAELAERGHSEPFSIRGGDRAYLAVAAPLAGEAAAGHAAYVLIAERPLAATPATTFSSLTGADLASREVAIAGGVLVASLIFGFLLLWLEHDRPSKRLLREVQDLARVEGDRLYDEHHRGRFGQIARHVNALLDRRKGGARDQRETQAGVSAPRGRSSVDIAPELPPPSFASPPSISQSVSTAAYVAQPIYASAPMYPPQPFDALAAGPAGPPPLLQPIGPQLTPTPMLIARPLDGPTDHQMPAIPSSDRLDAQTRDARPYALQLANEEKTHSEVESATAPRSRPPLAAFDAPPTVQVPDARRMGDEEATTVKPTDPQLLAQLKSFALPSMPAHAVTQQTPLPSESELMAEEFESVFRDFLETKRRCGESIDGVTYDKFVVKLRQNREQLISRYACKTVKFQVYVKDGKAALKATPVAR